MNTFQEILSFVHDRHVEIVNSGSTPWYRGQSNAQWPLESSIHRFVRAVNKEADGNMSHAQMVNLLRQEEKTNFHQFKSEASHILDPLQRSDWGLVFAMQHHGVPTRMLDWTTSFACALFFAWQDWIKNSEAVVFMADPQKINAQSINTASEIILDCDLREANVNVGYWHPGIMKQDKHLPCVAVQPVYTNSRMVVQQARFIACGDEFRSVDEQHPGAIHKIVLEPELAEEIHKFINLVGLGWSSYFPDLDGFARKDKARRQTTLDRVKLVRKGQKNT